MEKYITVAKRSNPPYNWFILSNEISANDCPLETKKINEKHRDVLYAYLKDINVEIELTNYISKDYDNHTVWYDVKKFIDSYDEVLEYRLKRAKPKNNFKDYGFEADFEGEILSQYQDELYGVVYRETGNNWVVIWSSKSGKCYNNDGDDIKKYNLKPIKKEWYENPDNIGKAIIIEEERLAILKGGINRTVVCIDIQHNAELSVNVEKCRPATKEEVLALLVKE